TDEGQDLVDRHEEGDGVDNAEEAEDEEACEPVGRAVRHGGTKLAVLIGWLQFRTSWTGRFGYLFVFYGACHYPDEPLPEMFAFIWPDHRFLQAGTCSKLCICAADGGAHEHHGLESRRGCPRGECHRERRLGIGPRPE